jgi:hypothetical protein
VRRGSEKRESHMAEKQEELVPVRADLNDNAPDPASSSSLGGMYTRTLHATKKVTLTQVAEGLHVRGVRGEFLVPWNNIKFVSFGKAP